MDMRVWLCEKPDQAKTLAPLLGGPVPGRGFIDTNDGRVTWAIGHLLQQAPPDAYDPKWARWDMETLPFVPTRWLLVPDPGKAQQLSVVVNSLKQATEVVIATDYGAEGEAIARELLDHAAYRGTIRRLKYSALDERSLRKALAGLLDGKVSEPLYWASQARSRADLLVGMNLSRAYTLRQQARAGGKQVLSVGRVQSPTLNLVVRRDREIEAFVPRAFYNLQATATTKLGESVVLRYAPAEDKRIFDRVEAERIAASLAGTSGPLKVESNECAKAPPKLLDITGLQKIASKQLGWKADHSLAIAQALYDKKLITYPRTECVQLPNEQEADIASVVEAIGKMSSLARIAAPLLLSRPVIRPSVFNTTKVNEHEHHAIVPTSVDPTSVQLDADERAAYSLVAQHYLASLMPDYRFAETRITMDPGSGVVLAAVGRTPLERGWQNVFGGDPNADRAADDDESVLPAIPDGCVAELADIAVKPGKTTPPKRYTDGDLIEDMRSVAKFATDPAVKARLKETSGIGTGATRANVIKILRTRGYVVDEGRSIVSTELGRQLIDDLPASISDPATTAVWEERLDQLRRGALPVTARDEFVDRVLQSTIRHVEKAKAEAAALASNRPATDAQVARVAAMAHALGIPVSAADSGSFARAAAFMERHGAAYQGLPPTAAQLAFAEKVAGEKGLSLTDQIRSHRGACGAWLDHHAPKAGKKTDPTSGSADRGTGGKGGRPKAASGAKPKRRTAIS